jgi:hypothetical protein
VSCGKLIQSLLCFDPDRRPPLFEVLTAHPVFASLRQTRALTKEDTSAGGGADRVVYVPLPALDAAKML